ncbi:MAG: aminotransferase class V-fold PLP-dependent enzyme [Bacteroidota bacterium]
MEVAEKTISRNLDAYFEKFRKNIIGNDAVFSSPYGEKRIIYADWIASGRLYRPIEEKLCNLIGPYVGNTHTETTVTGTSMTLAYHKAKEIIKQHVNSGPEDILITTGSGMTGVVNKFQRILGLKICEKLEGYLNVPQHLKPVVFVTHMEHHSNHTSWLETIADVQCIEPDQDGLVDLDHFAKLLEQYKDRKTKIAAVTSCSNVTGVFSPYHKIARMIHEAGGKCFVDFACSAPYVDINMHPEDPMEKLDAIYFSPHKFLGGPGTPGVLIFDSALYQNKIPDNPGGGTVSWTNPWGEHNYLEDIEAREDGGTPAFLQTIKAALAIQLKDEMGVESMLEREKDIIPHILTELRKNKNLHILADNITHRLGAISFYIDDLHYNLGVKLLNDKFGVQVRGGCSCAGTYGHYLLNVSKHQSNLITSKIDEGDLASKPGWIRLSVHPVMSDEEIEIIISAITQLSQHHQEWAKDYAYCNQSNEFTSLLNHDEEKRRVEGWFI